MLIALTTAFIASVAAMPLVRRFCIYTGYVSKPRKDRWHSQPTPTLGGVGIFIGFVAALAILTVVTGAPTRSIGEGLQAHWSLLLASGLMFLLGLYDDFKRISPPAKLIGQIAAAMLFIFFGGNTIRFFPWPIANIILTFGWLVGITNAINLLDNMDGLAGGVSLIAAGILSYFFWRSGDGFLLAVSLAISGGILGFLLFNFPPARIFMGDSGALFLGFTLSALAVVQRMQASNVLAIVGVPAMLFLLPILDTTLVTVTRLLRGQSPAQGGTDHTSHRLVAFGLTERQAVLTLYGVALVSGISAAALEALDYDLSLILAPVLLLSMSLFAAYLGRLKVVADINHPTTITPSEGLHSLGQTNPPNKLATRLMINLTYKRRLFEIALDLVLIGISYYLAYWVIFGLNMTPLSMNLFLRSWPLPLVFSYLLFFLAGVYRGLWRYLGVFDLLRFAGAALGSAILTALGLFLFDASTGYQAQIFLFYGIFLFLGLVASRFSFRILDRFYTFQQTRPGTANILIVGAQDAGELALRWMLFNPGLAYRPLGFLDEDPLLWGRSIHGIDVLGGSTHLESILSNRRVAGVILTPAISPQVCEKILELCRAKGVWVRMLRLEFELIG